MSVYFHRPLGRPPSVSIRLLAAVLAVTLAGLAPAAAQETALAARADAADTVAAPAQTSDAGSGSAAASYRLGPGELISLRVVVWDSVELSFVDLEAISGTYTIGPDGAVMLPILG
ncbi:MAG: polysaccharide biosynthesis/export family protein, partial [Pseudomonadota bacterium]